MLLVAEDAKTLVTEQTDRPHTTTYPVRKQAGGRAGNLSLERQPGLIAATNPITVIILITVNTALSYRYCPSTTIYLYYFF